MKITPMIYEIYFEFGDETIDYITVYSKSHLSQQIAQMQKSHLYRKLKYRTIRGSKPSNWTIVDSCYGQSIYDRYTNQVQQEYQRRFKDRTK